MILLYCVRVSLVVSKSLSQASIPIGKHISERFTEEGSMINLSGCLFTLTVLIID